MNKLPILFIIPHGGYKIPEELITYSNLNKFDLFISADSCANEVFSFQKQALAVVDTHISKLFLDLNRAPLLEIPEEETDSVIKKSTPFGKEVFKEESFPGEIAIKNILRRYYHPFHETVEKIKNSGEIKLIIECHTTLAIGPKNAPDADSPRPLVTIHNLVEERGSAVESCPPILAKLLLEMLQKEFSSENESVVKNPFVISKKPLKGYIAQNSLGRVPYLRVDISRSLFINDKHFNYDFLKVDQIRLKQIKKKIWNAIEKSYNKMLY